MAEDQVVLKHDELFVVCDALGDIDPLGPHGAGLYFRDMRHLSTLALHIDGCPLELLDLGTDAIDHLVVYLANQRVVDLGDHEALPQTIVVTRRRELRDGGLTELVTLTNYNAFAAPLQVSLRAAADFRDLFDIRGLYFQRDTRPQLPRSEDGGYLLLYDDVAGNRYTTAVRAMPAPSYTTVEAGAGYTSELRVAVTVMPGHDRVTHAPVPLPAPAVTMTHELTLAPGASTTLEYVFEPRVVESSGRREAPRRLEQSADGELAGGWAARAASIVTSNEAFNIVLERSAADLQTLFTPLPDGGCIIAAGIPWYVAPFGRDSLIVARQLLPWYPDIAAATLRYLASVQGDEDDPTRDEEPGKIVHEIRFGEMARRRLVPHSRYYGTVDATPLFLWLAGQYAERCGDDQLLTELLPNVRRALDWVDGPGDSNRDGLVDFARRGDASYENQNWKDSGNSLQRPDGQPLPGPIANVEAQGYVYAAKRQLAHELGQLDGALARRLHDEADALRERIEREYWQPDLNYYAEALDGRGAPARAISSNAAHLLASGVPDDSRAAAVVNCLSSAEMFSGWGVRTLSTAMPHYNPVSYHNGSVWPHDNGFVLWGLRRYRQFAALDRVATALFEAATRFPYGRLPELLCGFPRGASTHDVPVAYPVSCAPQAWAAGVPYVMVEALLGLEIEAQTRIVRLDPWLPEWLERVEIRGLVVGEHDLDLRVSGRHDQIEVHVLRNPGRVRVAL
jgi:glycogen debranching enzyme